MRRLAIAILFILISLTVSFSQVVPPASSEGYFQSDEGFKLYYRIIGSGPDTVVIPLASWYGTSLDPLASSHTLILYDVRNRGRSAQVADTTRLGIPFEIRDLERLRKHFRISKMSLIGLSYLGLEVAAYSIEYPHYVSKIIQVGPAGPRPDFQYAKDPIPQDYVVDSNAVFALRQMRARGDDAKNPTEYCRLYWEVNLPRYIGNQTVLSSINIPCELPNEAPANLSRSVRFIFRSLAGKDYRSQVRSLRMPLLTIHGDWDRIAPLQGGQEWVASFPNARLLVLPKAGHLPFLEYPEIFISAVDSFLKGNWPEGSITVESKEGR